MNLRTIDLKLLKRALTVQVARQAGAVRLALSPTFQVTAKVTTEGAPPRGASGISDPRLAPWKLGFMQARILETNWAYYRGAQSSEGCVLNDHSAGATLQICRDYDQRSGTVWYECTNTPSDSYGVPDWTKSAPWKMEFFFGDSPTNDLHEKVINRHNQRYNTLHEARVALAFVTTLTELDNGSFRHHRHFFWSVVWHLQASGNPAAPYRLLPGSGFWISDFKAGGPTDKRHLAVLNNPAITPSCNDVVGSTPVVKQDSPVWQRFAVMDQKDKLF